MGRPGKPCKWNDREFPSLTAAAKWRGVTKVTMKNWIDAGYTCDEDVPPVGGATPCKWNGTLYPSITAAAEAAGMSPQAMHQHKQKGYNGDEDLKWVLRHDR